MSQIATLILKGTGRIIQTTASSVTMEALGNNSSVIATDSYHTMDELYQHRHALFCALVKIYDNYITPLGTTVKCWKSKLHDDGTMFDDSFIVGMTLKRIEFDPNANIVYKFITYHLPLSWWDKFKIMELDRAPKWDGHSSEDVIERLLEL